MPETAIAKQRDSGMERLAEKKLVGFARVNVKAVPKKDKTQVGEDAVRPYRIWSELLYHDVPHKCYVHEERAKLGALIECKHAKVGDTFQVYDARSGRSVASYRRGVSSIIFLKD